MTPLRLAITAAAALAIAIASVAMPSHAQSAPVDPSAINATCLSGTDDMVVSASASSGGFLMCITTDADVEGVAVYQESSPGSNSFSLLRGAGGIYGVSDLEAMGISATDANNLYSSIAQQMQTFGN